MKDNHAAYHVQNLSDGNLCASRMWITISLFFSLFLTFSLSTHALARFHTKIRGNDTDNSQQRNSFWLFCVVRLYNYLPGRQRCEYYVGEGTAEV